MTSPGARPYASPFPGSGAGVFPGQQAMVQAARQRAWPAPETRAGGDRGRPASPARHGTAPGRHLAGFPDIIAGGRHRAAPEPGAGPRHDPEVTA